MDIINQVVNVVLLLSLIKAEGIKTFPEKFSLGTGSSAYQIEGAWDKDGKSENIWDHWIHTDPTHIKNNDTPDFMNFYRFPDLEEFYVSELAAEHYRFSISWSRILPDGVAGKVNENGVLYYQTLLEYLERDGIIPVLTLYYNDLPQVLQDLGGWTNPDMVKYFADYARVCFQNFHNINYWITFNDPRSICRNGYGDGSMAPGIASDGEDEYLCAYTVLKAHAAAYYVYKEEFKNLAGKLSIALDMKWSIPSSEKDSDAVERRNAFEFGLYADPIYKGDWPKIVKDRIEFRSKNENNFTQSRLPQLTNEEINYINCTSDFMSVNIYFTHMVEDTEEAEFGDPSFIKDMKAKVYVNENWTMAVNGQPILPESARNTLVWLKDNYNNPDIFITENGVPDNDTQASYDIFRINYYRDYLSAVLDAINEDGVNVVAYTAWSLSDGFEWTDGYSYRSGFVYIDFRDPVLLLVKKQSYMFYNQVIETRTLPEEYTTTVTTTYTTSEPDITTPGSAAKATFCPLLVLTTMVLCNYYFK